jgi:hypothetical protein
MTHDRHRQNPDYKDPLRDFHPSTAVIHAGYRARLSENAVKPPVFRTSTSPATTVKSQGWCIRG